MKMTTNSVVFADNLYAVLQIWELKPVLKKFVDAVPRVLITVIPIVITDVRKALTPLKSSDMTIRRRQKSIMTKNKTNI